MYASDVIRRNRNAIIAFNLQEQQAAFDAGLTNNIPRQKGGSDYIYLTNISQAEVETPQLLLTPILNIIKVRFENRVLAVNLIEFNRLDFNQIDDRRPTLLTDGSGNYILDSSGNITRDSSGNPLLTASGNPVLDDATIRIPMGSMDFYFFGINYGANNDIYWNTNNAITFGNNYNLNTVSFNANTIPAILLGNYDRLSSELYHKSYAIYNFNIRVADIKTIVVEFADYYTDTSNFEAGKYQIRFIREAADRKRQWVEVSIISSPLHPGYSTNVTGPVNPAGYNFDASGNRASMIDSNGNTVNPTKISPYDITDGTTFLNVAGTTYSGASPPIGTSFVYQSNSNGYSWEFINNAYVDI